MIAVLFYIRHVTGSVKFHFLLDFFFCHLANQKERKIEFNYKVRHLPLFIFYHLIRSVVFYIFIFYHLIRIVVFYTFCVIYIMMIIVNNNRLGCKNFLMEDCNFHGTKAQTQNEVFVSFAKQTSNGDVLVEDNRLVSLNVFTLTAKSLCLLGLVVY